jgi:anaerobic ribonucleoside-triphosphate reductase activating protein
LLPLLRARCRGDILLFSGHRHETIVARYAEIVSKVDVLISGPYSPKAGATRKLRGSDNQRVSLLSELARARYPANLDRQPRTSRRRLDIAVDGENVWMAGILSTGDMSRLRRCLAKRGFNCRTSDQPPNRA